MKAQCVTAYAQADLFPQLLAVLVFRKRVLLSVLTEEILTEFGSCPGLRRRCFRRPLLQPLGAKPCAASPGAGSRDGGLVIL